MTDGTPPLDELRRLRQWLVEDAFPLWSTRGLDPVRGGFQESLHLDGTPTAAPRRARVQARQVFAFAQAAELGWRGDAAGAAHHGLAYFLTHYRRRDGLFRTVVAPDGTALDERALLYDQAFALLALAEGQKVLDAPETLVDEGRRLRDAIHARLKRPAPGFWSGLPDRLPLLANPHMHLLEAALAWIAISDDPEWRAVADEIGTLALSHLIDGPTGFLREEFDGDWSPAAGLSGRIVEPGHQLEWAWLLLRWDGPDRRATQDAAFRLIALGERHGVHDGVAVDALLDDGSIHDAAARLWPQTERLKAATRAAELTGSENHWADATEAARCLLRYLDTPHPGLWRDRLRPDGTFVEQPAAASSFYHIVASIAELSRVLGAG